MLCMRPRNGSHTPDIATWLQHHENFQVIGLVPASMSEYHKARWFRVTIAPALRPCAPVWGRPTYLAASVGKTGLPSKTEPLSVGFRGMLLLCHGYVTNYICQAPITGLIILCTNTTNMHVGTKCTSQRHTRNCCSHCRQSYVKTPYSTAK
jgi:hypothetical protein